MKHPISTTLLVRDEVDIVDTNIDYHVARGVSHAVLTSSANAMETCAMARVCTTPTNRRSPAALALTVAIALFCAPVFAEDLLMYGPSLANWLETNDAARIDSGRHDHGSKRGAAGVFTIDESHVAEDAGHTVTIVDEAQWLAMTTPEFAAFDAIVIGDAGCDFDEGELLEPLQQNREIWSRAVTGHLFLHTFDPFFHFNQNLSVERGGDSVPTTPEQFQAMVDLSVEGIEYAASADSTGLYYANGCRVFDGAGGPAGGIPTSEPVDFLALLARVSLTLDQGGDAVEISAPAHPAMLLLTNDGLSNWIRSYHAEFDDPGSQFDVLAIEPSIVDPERGAIEGGIILATIEPIGDAVVFLDGFESGNADAWSSSTGD